MQYTFIDIEAVWDEQLHEAYRQIDPAGAGELMRNGQQRRRLPCKRIMAAAAFDLELHKEGAISILGLTSWSTHEHGDEREVVVNLLEHKPPYHRDGWVFQAISWIAAHSAAAGAVIRAPHMIHAHKGFDGFQLKLDESGQTVSAVVIFEDKATENPRSTIARDVWKGIRALESGQRMNELIPEVGGLLEAHQQRFPELDVDGAVERIAWEEARQFRVAVTADIVHDDDDVREALFKGFDEVAPGIATRRQAETIAIPMLRDWMKAFSAKAIKQIEAWRDDV